MDSESLKFESENLKTINFMRQAVEVNGYALSHADESFQSIEDIEVIVAKHLGLGRNFTDWHFCRVVFLVFFGYIKIHCAFLLCGFYKILHGIVTFAGLNLDTLQWCLWLRRG